MSNRRCSNHSLVTRDRQQSNVLLCLANNVEVQSVSRPQECNKTQVVQDTVRRSEGVSLHKLHLAAAHT